MKGGLVNTSLPTIRKELQECFRHCERLLASALMSDCPPFTQEELAMMKYYADEIAKISVSQDKISVAQDMKLRISENLDSESNGKSGMTTGGHETGSQELVLTATVGTIMGGDGSMISPGLNAWMGCRSLNSLIVPKNSTRSELRGASPIRILLRYVHAGKTENNGLANIVARV